MIRTHLEPENPMTSVAIPDIEHVEWCGTVAGRGGSLVAVCLTERAVVVAASDVI